MESLKNEYAEKAGRYGRLLEARQEARERGWDGLLARFTIEMMELDLRLKNIQWAIDRLATEAGEDR